MAARPRARNFGAAGRARAQRASRAGKIGALEKDKREKGERVHACSCSSPPARLVLLPHPRRRRGWRSSPPATRLLLLPAGDAAAAPPRPRRGSCSSPPTTQPLLLPVATRLLFRPDAGSACAPPRRRSPPSGEPQDDWNSDPSDWNNCCWNKCYWKFSDQTMDLRKMIEEPGSIRCRTIAIPLQYTQELPSEKRKIKGLPVPCRLAAVV